MLRLLGLSVLLLALQAVCSTAFADDADTCVKAAGDESIAACTRVIAAGQGNLAWAYMYRGNAYDDKGNKDRAFADYDEAIRLDPKYAMAYYNRAIAYRGKGDNDRAIADYEEAIRLDPKYALAYYSRGNAYHDKGDNNRAIADYDKAIRLDPKYAKAYSHRGDAYYAKGNKDRAIADYDKAIRLDPKDAEAYTSRGYAYDDKGNKDRAIADYDEAIRLDPKYALAYYNRGVAYHDKGNYDRAIADYDEAIRLDPKNASAYNNRGHTYTDKGEYDRAIADFDETIRLDPGYTAAFTNRGLAYEKKGDRERARADFNAALTVPQKYSTGKWAHDTARERLAALDKAAPTAAKPPADDADICVKATGDERIAACTRVITARKGNLSWAYNNRGLAYGAKGDYDRAIADFDEAIRLNPKDATAYYNRGLAYGDKGDNDRAIADFDEAIRLGPKYTGAYYNRGFAYQLKGNNDRAIADYDEAIRLDPKYTQAYNNRGTAYRAKGDYDRAIADFYEAIRLDPGYTAAFTNRGLAYEKKGDRERARADFNAALTVPQKYGTGKWAHDTARERLAALDKAAPTAAKPPVPAPVPQAMPSSPSRRVALVIGNSGYAAVPALPNPKRDAEAVAAGLREIGFQSVTVINDASRDAMVRALSVFGREADNADWALVYYAGHGIEVGGSNYLIPVDARLASDRDVSIEAVSLDQIMGYAQGARKLRMVLLDACRENPFIAKMARRDASRSVGRGLARVEPEGGTLVAYAAKDGQVAQDGSGTNSPFTTALLKHIGTPRLDVRLLFGRVRDDVLAATGRKQEPFVYGSLPGEEFFFVAAKP